MSDKAWKRLERDVGKHFGTGRNIKRGADFSIEDTDVDVFDGFAKLIIDCKYGKTAKGLISRFKKHAGEAKNKRLMPVMLVVFGTKHYWVCRLADFKMDTGVPVPQDIENTWPGSTVMRGDAKYMNEWFKKLNDVYKPQKAEEFKVDAGDIFSAVVIRDKSSKETLIIWEH